MRTFYARSFLSAAVALSAVAVHASVVHCEPGSFLNKRCVTVEQLINETEHDRQVQDRYCRHFQMTEPELIKYFEHLHVGRIETTGAYVVYNCHDDGIIRARVFHLRQGTPVFVDENGKPILKWSCGNPMVAPKPKVVVVIKTKIVPHEHIVYVPQPAPVVPPPVVIPPPAPIVPPPPIPPAPPVVNNYTTTNSSVVTKSASSLFILPVLLIFNNHSNHNIEHKQPVPEPASMLVFAVGAAGMLIRRKRTR